MSSRCWSVTGWWGASTCRGNRIYLFIMNWPDSESLQLPPIPHSLVSRRALTRGEVTVQQTDASIQVDCPARDRDQIATVIELTIDGNAVEVAPR